MAGSSFLAFLQPESSINKGMDNGRTSGLETKNEKEGSHREPLFADMKYCGEMPERANGKARFA
jgi:hypothetical protein